MGPNDKGLELGDVVDVRGKIVGAEVFPDKVMIEFYSEYHGPITRWFRNDMVTLVTKGVDADEPPPGSLVEVVAETGHRFYYLRDEETSYVCRWRRQGSTTFGPITWRTLKAQGQWTRLYREGEV